MAVSCGTRNQYFSIDDAFEEETDEAIKVYGCSTVKSSSHELNKPNEERFFENSERTSKTTIDDTISKDSDSLIPEYSYNLKQISDEYWWQHPKIQENRKTVLSAVTLLLIGTILLALGMFALAKPQNGLHWAVFVLAGLICFIPGAYHVVYIWFAARGRRGYDFYHLPLFT